MNTRDSKTLKKLVDDLDTCLGDFNVTREFLDTIWRFFRRNRDKRVKMIKFLENKELRYFILGMYYNEIDINIKKSVSYLVRGAKLECKQILAGGNYKYIELTSLYHYSLNCRRPDASKFVDEKTKSKLDLFATYLCLHDNKLCHWMWKIRTISNDCFDSAMKKIFSDDKKINELKLRNAELEQLNIELTTKLETEETDDT